MRRVTLSATAMLLLAHLAAAQTVVTPPKNKYDVKEDVQLGREAAAEVEKQLPLLRDDNIQSYIEGIGERLARAIPANLQHQEFRYTFKVVNVREINAFALPGGPMYVNRGMMEAAKTEGEIAGVMAHELSHVALRHGTAQATKSTPFAIGQMAGAIAGAIIGGRTGSILAQGSQVGFGTWFMKYSREYEKQADLLGAQIMARAGYDPRDMANMFKTIEAQGRSSGPEFLSDHPNPGNRYEYINQEARQLRIENRVTDTRGFQSAKSRLAQMSPAPTTEQVMKNAPRPTSGSGRNDPATRPEPSRVPQPESRMTAYDEGNLFRIRVPSNWRELPGNNSVTFAPEGAYGTVNQQSVFTHGVQVGIARNESHDLQTATDELIQSLAQSNPRLGRQGGYSRAQVGNTTGLRTTLSNVSDATGGNEQIAVYTTQMRDGTLFYMVGVAPAEEFGRYDGVFRKVATSIEFAR
ncbi:MAG TPA: M48 family metallopeptidase [Vicinamibacterales bacterium]